MIGSALKETSPLEICPDEEQEVKSPRAEAPGKTALNSTIELLGTWAVEKPLVCLAMAFLIGVGTACLLKRE